MSLKPDVQALATRRVILGGQEAVLGGAQGIFQLWILLHRPLAIAIAMYSLSFVPDAKCLSCHTELKERIDGGVGWHAEVTDRKCIGCHSGHSGLDGSLTEAHALAAFGHAVTGVSVEIAHGRTTCEDCHSKPLREMAGACAGCHEDSHHPALKPACGTCHASTRSELKGRHLDLLCTDCHAADGTLGRIP